MKQKLGTLLILSLFGVLVLGLAIVAMEVLLMPPPSNAQGEPTPNPYQVTHADLVATSQAQAAQSPGVVEEMPYPGNPDFRGSGGGSVITQQIWTMLKTRWQALFNIFKTN